SIFGPKRWSWSVVAVRGSWSAVALTAERRCTGTRGGPAQHVQDAHASSALSARLARDRGFKIALVLLATRDLGDRLPAEAQVDVALCDEEQWHHQEEADTAGAHAGDDEAKCDEAKDEQ